DVYWRAAARLRSAVGLPPIGPPIPEADYATVRNTLGFEPSGLLRVYLEHRGRTAHKWVHYLNLYERYLSQFRDREPVVLEIGVSDGGSLEIWREFFGPTATICGIDVNPHCAQVVDPPNLVRIGS